jgi:aspartyl-tRNA(Asn)/glutamyl-tRNA(Gln) amidotransferase subunit A
MKFEEMTALALGRSFEDGKADPREVTEAYLERVRRLDPDRRIYVSLLETRARAEAAAAHDRAKRGLRLHALDGVPLSWKDLFDVAGEPTASGSLALKDNVPARDCELLARATRLGSVALGKTTMTELAFSGLGINPKIGTPANPHDEKIERVPGGSSAGAGVSVAAKLAPAAIGSDTGGSVRIPAAWNGLVGLKTTATRLPMSGTVPLSPTFDTAGPLARDVGDAAALLALLDGRPVPPLHAADLSRTVFWVPENGIVWENTEPQIISALYGAIHRLVHAGARIIERPLRELDEIHALTWDPKASRLVAEAYAQWGEMLAANEELIYRPVFERVMAGAKLKAADIIRADLKRREISARYIAATAGVDAVIFPTVAIAPPPIATLEDGGDAYGQANRMALRNATIGNQLGLTAITLPCGRDDNGIPIGLMLQAAPMREEKLLSLALAIERLFSRE